MLALTQLLPILLLLFVNHLLSLMENAVRFVRYSKARRRPRRASAGGRGHSNAIGDSGNQICTRLNARHLRARTWPLACAVCRKYTGRVVGTRVATRAAATISRMPIDANFHRHFRKFPFAFFFSSLSFFFSPLLQFPVTRADKLSRGN